ncbi:hypothetical protein pAEv1812_29 [Aeromonas phage pAEv1812]|nr:hypothetical protein pAEv1812_29 [Aeromonas phage pAEv1812]
MGKKKKQTVGFRYFVGVHFVLCHGPIDRVKAVWVDDKLLWQSIGPDATAPGMGSGNGYENINVNQPNLFGGEDREGGVSGDFEIGMGYPTQPPNGYLARVLPGKRLPGYRGVVSLILKQMYVGNNPYLKPWKIRAQRIWAPDTESKPQWSPSYAGIGPKFDGVVNTEASATVVIGDNLYRIPAAIYRSSDATVLGRNTVVSWNIKTGKSEVHSYNLAPPANGAGDYTMAPGPHSRPQQDGIGTFNGPTGVEIFAGIFTQQAPGTWAGISGGNELHDRVEWALILCPSNKTHRWIKIPAVAFARPGYPVFAQNQYTVRIICWAVLAANGRIFIRSFASNSQPNWNYWIQGAGGTQFKLVSLDPVTGALQDEPWGNIGMISPPVRGTGIIAAAVKPDRSAVAEHQQFLFAINGNPAPYNSLVKFDLVNRKVENLGGAERVQALLWDIIDHQGYYFPSPKYRELGRAAWGYDDNIYVMMPRGTGQRQNGMLGVWYKNSNPAGTVTTWNLDWPTSSEYTGDPKFWWAPVPVGDPMDEYATDWFGCPVCLDDGRVVFPPGMPFQNNGVLLIPDQANNGRKGVVRTDWDGVTLGGAPYPVNNNPSYPVRDYHWTWHGDEFRGYYMSAVKTGPNDFIMTSACYGAGTLSGPRWRGDLAGEDQRFTRFLVSYSESKYFRLMTNFSQGPWDMNPVHIIRECMTNKVWGRGLPDSIIGPSYTKAAQTLYAEGLGLSMLWTSEMAVNDFILEVIRHIDAVRYEDPETGLQEIKLIRPDYDVSTLPVLSPSNCVLDQLTEPTLYDLVNQITVNFWNRETGEDSAIAVQDTASINMTGTVNNQTMEYSGICSTEVAMMVAQRDLARYSKPFRQGRLVVNRKVANLKPGDPFILVWPARGVDRLVCRAAKRADNGELDGRIGIEFGEDIFSQPFNIAGLPPPSGWEDPILPPANFDYVTMFEAPYPMLVDMFGEDDASATDPSICNPGFAGARPLAGMHLNYGCWMYPEGTTPPTDIQLEIRESFTPLGIVGEAVPAISAATVEIELQVANDMGNVRAGDLVLVGTAGDVDREILAVAETPGNNPAALKVVRAVADTYPRAIPKGAPLFVVSTFFGYDDTDWAPGEVVSGYGAPKNGKGAFEGPYTYLSIPMNGRQGRPYPAANFQVDGSYYSDPDVAKSQVALTWRSRNRVIQSNQSLSWLEDSNVAVESGAVFRLRQVPLDQSGAKLPELPLIDLGSATSYDLDLAGQPYPVEAAAAVLSVEAVRDGLVSLQNRPITVRLTPRLYAPTGLKAEYVGVPGLVAPTSLQAIFDAGMPELRAPANLQAVFVQGVEPLLAPDNLVAQYAGLAKLQRPSGLQAVFVPGTAPLLAPVNLVASYTGPAKLVAPVNLVAEYHGTPILQRPSGLQAVFVPGMAPLAAPDSLVAVYTGQAKLLAPGSLVAVYTGPAKLLAPDSLVAVYTGPAKLLAPDSLVAVYTGPAKLLAPDSLAVTYRGTQVLQRPGDLSTAYFSGVYRLQAPVGLSTSYH